MNDDQFAAFRKATDMAPEIFRKQTWPNFLRAGWPESGSEVAWELFRAAFTSGAMAALDPDTVESNLRGF